MTTIADAVRKYIARGFAPIPIPPNKKNPNRKGWQGERWTLEDVPSVWNDGQGVGLLLGEPSGGLVDVDLDRPESRAVARQLLPDTLKSGRESLPGGHYWYSTDPIPKTRDFKLPGKGDDRCIVELRSTGRQTVVAPSTHPDGDRYSWAGGELATLSGDVLDEHVEDVATAALLLINYPGEGARHDYIHCASGYLGRHMAHERVKRIMEAVIRESGDEEARRRFGDVADTLDALERGEAVTGGPKLEALAPGTLKILQGWGCVRPASRAHPLREDECDAGMGDEELGLVWAGDMGAPEPQEFVAKPAIPKPFPTVIHGAGGSAKSYMVLDFALRYTNKGGEWLGMPIHGRGRVLYVDFELNVAEFNRRVHKLAKGMGLDGRIKDLGYFEVGELSTRAAFARIRVLCEKHGFDVVIVDSVGPALDGDTTSAADVITFHRRYITPLRKAGVTPVLVDHQARAYSEEDYQLRGAFGSSYKEHLARSVIQVQPQPQAEDSAELEVRVRHRKANFTGRFEPFNAVIAFGEGEITICRRDISDDEIVTERAVDLGQRILVALKDGPAAAEDLANRVGANNEGSVRNKLSRLKKDGKVVEHAKEGNKIIWALAVPASSAHPYKRDECDAERENRDGTLWEGEL